MAEKKKFQAIKGTRDLLPPETELWNRVEQTAREVFGTYGFGEIRPPIFEPTELFARAVGGETDIVSKEMYTFEDHAIPGLERDREAVMTADAMQVESLLDFSTDLQLVVIRLKRAMSDDELDEKNETLLRQLEQLQSRVHFDELIHGLPATFDDLYNALKEAKYLVKSLDLGNVLSLRPEATASICRAYIEHNMHALPQPVKLFCFGPMFRRERPQKGRYRQFYQIDAEILETVQRGQGGAKDLAKDAAVDAEVIEMVMVFFARLELQGVVLEINSIGCRECRPKYVELLRVELQKVKDKLGADSQRRIETNPLRVLDSKLESEQAIIEKLPRIGEHLCADCGKHYAEVKRQLGLRGVAYKENWRLVRGLDYYMRTTFEITAQGLGSQNAVCGGGRYDGLVELLGGPPTKGIGFAIGEDRLILSLQDSDSSLKPPSKGVYIVWMGETAHTAALSTAAELRNKGFRVELPPVEQKVGKALSQADKLGTNYAVILGENEISSGEYTVKVLSTGTQTKVPKSQLAAYLNEQFV